MFKQQLNITIFMIIQLINMNILLSPIVSDLNRCSRTQSMQADDHSATRCIWSSCSLVVDVEEVVVRERAVAWRRSPKTLSSAYPEQDLSSKARFRRLCSRLYRARGASDGNAKRKQQTEGERERSPEQEYLMWNWPPRQEEEGDLYRRAGVGGWTWTSWLIRLMQ
jgi:hypothetical protein